MSNKFSSNNYYALILGIDKYNSNEIADLDKSSKDANDISKYLTTKGGYNSENIILLVNEDVNKHKIMMAFKELSNKMDKESTCLFFISGHGASINNEYVLPLYDYSQNNDSTYYTEKEITELFAGQNASRQIILLDSCHAGMLAKEKKQRTGMSEQFLEKIVSSVPVNESRVIVASSLPNQSSYESNDLNNGLFTYCLLNALNGECKTSNKNSILLLDLVKYLIKEVPSVAKQYNLKQNCCVKTSILYQDFPVCLSEGEPIDLFSSKVEYPQLPNRFINAIVDLEEDQNALLKKYISCLNNRKLDSKFAYWGEEVTKKYIELLNTESYTLPNMTRKLLGSNIDDIISKINIEKKGIRVISLGIGDGYKDAIILNKILESISISIDYWIIEISYEMIKIGLNNVRLQVGDDNYQRIVPTLFQTDFLDINILSDLITDDKDNLFLLLGNTLGNFPEDILLNRISSVMKANDYFLIDNQIRGENKITKKEEKDLINMYRSDKYDEYILSILKKANITKKDGRIQTRVDSDRNANILTLRKYYCVTVVQEFVFSRNKEVEISGMKASFVKGSIIPVIYSRKYTKNALNALLQSYFNVVGEPYFSTSGKYALVLLQKK